MKLKLLNIFCPLSKYYRKKFQLECLDCSFRRYFNASAGVDIKWNRQDIEAFVENIYGKECCEDCDKVNKNICSLCPYRAFFETIEQWKHLGEENILLLLEDIKRKCEVADRANLEAYLYNRLKERGEKSKQLLMPIKVYLGLDR